MFLVLCGVVLFGQAACLWWVLKHGRTPVWFFWVSATRAEQPTLYWIQIGCMASTMLVVASLFGALGWAVLAR